MYFFSFNPSVNFLSAASRTGGCKRRSPLPYICPSFWVKRLNLGSLLFFIGNFSSFPVLNELSIVSVQKKKKSFSKVSANFQEKQTKRVNSILLLAHH